MPLDSESSEGLAVFRHKSGAEMPIRAVGYAAMHGVVRVEGGVRDGGIHLNGYYYDRTERFPDQPPPDVSHPWPTMILSRSDFVELCDVIDRETSGDPFDYAGVEAGHLRASPRRLVKG